MRTTYRDFSCRYKPEIKISVQRVESDVWTSLGFYKHHYMTSALNKTCKCLLFYVDDVPAAFVALINQPMKGHPWGFRISRIVINPDFQGLGLARRILDFCGGIIKAFNDESELYIKTIHEKMGKMFDRNSNWSPTCYNGKARNDPNDKGGKYKNRLKRKSYCYKFCGGKIDGYGELLLPINELRDKKMWKLLL